MQNQTNFSLSTILVTPMEPSGVPDQRICITRRVRRVTAPSFSNQVQISEVTPPVEPLQLTSNRSLSLSTPMLVPIRSNRELTFEEACSDPNFTVAPLHAGFIPRNAWGNQPIAFGLLVATFFRKRNSMHCKFPFKLYNSLRLTLTCPAFFKYIGTRWITETVFIVDKIIFAKLLGVRSIDGSFFHQQGNFPSHGFEELQFIQAQKIAREQGIGDFDPTNIRFLRHASGRFNINSTEADIFQLKWTKA
ncbi:hypothetical protein TRFO_16675 [Tritrichomonas foetus]|uniref:Initiator binding domain-containing protein n=1 Tax=Tritrichomonas foetus TaxID=1144522 RepID=A0A1J4KPJ9_9EUKA|nr:hypothetical protein TRFO_16675 [Tritrichomonas foetus]|eukprot:OHT13233.1 hypothetical protein TRFO_16675 [Tritrichomonas foetus]